MELSTTQKQAGLPSLCYLTGLCRVIAVFLISRATRKCRRPQITPTRDLHCGSHSSPCAPQIYHRHCRGLPRRVAIIVRNCKGGQRGGPGAYTCFAGVIATHHDAAAGFANCNPDAQRACQPRRRFRVPCCCCACIAHNPCRMCGTNSFIGPTCWLYFTSHTHHTLELVLYGQLAMACTTHTHHSHTIHDACMSLPQHVQCMPAMVMACTRQATCTPLACYSD